MTTTAEPASQTAIPSPIPGQASDGSREIATMRALMPRFAERVAEHDRESTFPYENVDLLLQHHLQLMTLAPELGGLGTPLPAMAQVMRLMGASDPITALVITQHVGSIGTHSVVATHHGHEKLREFLVSEIATGKVLGLFGGAPEFEERAPAQAIRVDGGFLLRGRKGWGTACRAADWGTANFSWDNDGVPSTVFVVFPTRVPEFEIVETWDTFGMRATHSHDIRFNDLFVPDRHVLWSGPEAELNNSSFGMALYRFGMICFAALYLGIADSAFEVTKAALAERTPLGSTTPSILNPGLQSFLGEIGQKQREAGAMLSWTVHQHQDPTRWDAATMIDIMVMKDSVTRDAVQIVEMCMQALGGPAYYTRQPLERMYRDVRAGPIHPFNHPMVVATTGRILAGAAMARAQAARG